MNYWILLYSANAAPFVTNISDDIDLQVGGNWSIPMVIENEWHIALAQHGDLLVMPIEDGSWEVNYDDAIALTGRSDLSDHSIRRCPDGTWLHVASSVPTNYVYRYDQNFNLDHESIYSQGEPPHAANDVPAVCGPRFQGFGIAEQIGLRDYFIDVDFDASLSSPTEMADAPRMTGAGLLDDDEWEELLTVGVDPGPNLMVSAYDVDLNLKERWTIERPDPDLVLYWPSSFTRVGDFFLVLTMGRDPAENWDADTGDVYLFVVDQTFELMEWHQLTFADPFLGGFMRPWLARKDDQIVMGFDKGNAIFIAHADLNLGEFNVAEDPPPSTNDDSWREEEASPKNETVNGGCRDNGQSMLPLLLPLFGWRYRANQSETYRR